MIRSIFNFYYFLFKMSFYAIIGPFYILWWIFKTFIKLVFGFMFQLEVFLGVFNAKQAMRRRGWF